jgi:sterol 3beta-glucosyltransferase
MVNDNEHHQSADSQKDGHASTPASLGLPNHHRLAASSANPVDTPHITENVRATLSPLPAPHLGRSSVSDISARSSTDAPRKSSWDVRRSMDASRALRRPSHEVRRSFSGGRSERQPRVRAADPSPLSPAADTESGTLSLDPGTESSAAVQSIDDSSASASQILNRSDVFRAPAVYSPDVSLSEQLDQATRYSQDTTRSSGAAEHTRSRNRSGKQMNNVPLPGPTEVEEDTDPGQAPSRLSNSSSALQDIASYPLQKASGIAGFLRTRSKKMGNLLATESMGYYEKVSGMLAGGRKHYNTADGLEPHDQVHGFEDDEDTAKAAENFRDHFAFPETEILQSSFFASLQRVLPNYGKVYISGRYFCFRSLMPTSKTKVSLLLHFKRAHPLTDPRLFSR